MDKTNNKNALDLILGEIREAAKSPREMGDAFERLMVTFLVNDPLYKARFDDVWLWGEWPDRSGPDVGIDIVAKAALTGDYCAIQCKFYLPNHIIKKDNIDSFFTASGKRFPTNDGDQSFTSRIVISTTDNWSTNAEAALKDQTIPCNRIRLQDLDDSPIDWLSYHSGITKLEPQPRKELREHQSLALEKTLAGFKDRERGKLIMACGTGKTFTALKIMENQTTEQGLILFLVPSISLLSQTLREWVTEGSTPFHAFVVCSDTKVGKEREDLSAHDLAYPATTDFRKLAKHIHYKDPSRRIVVFSTYQSIQVLGDAQQREGLRDFDLIICDEAHRTTGITLDGDDASNFTKVHKNSNIKGKQRLYMTATPRIFTDASKKKAGVKRAVLYSMDDPDLYGEEFYRLGFDEAVRRDILTDYKVLIVAIEEEMMADIANETNTAYSVDKSLVIDTKLAVRIIGSWKGLAKRGLQVVNAAGEIGPLTEDTEPMRRAVAFSSSIKGSKEITSIFKKVVEIFVTQHGGDDRGDDDNGMIICNLGHVDGTNNALMRSAALDWLRDGGGEKECRILSNARCLSEGVDIPALDSVIFFDTRESIVDIVQSVGRVMRKADSKQYGYIILPVGIPSKKVHDYNNYIASDPQFKSIWKIIKALRAHDESLVDEAEFRRKITIATVGPGTDPEDGEKGIGNQAEIDFPPLPVDALTEAVYAAIPAKLGDREYWTDWAKDIGKVADRLIVRIKQLIQNDTRLAADFKTFVKGFQDTLNPSVTADDAIEMLAQHILTLPVFKSLFADNQFPNNNAVANALQRIVQKLDSVALEKETEGLDKFYENVRDRVTLAKSDKSKQDIIRNLYDTFFHNAFPRMAQRLGIVYTPVEVVDFILKSTDDALQKHFGKSIGNKDIQILDPFAGTGTFLVRLIQSGLISNPELPYKFEQELHANEIVLLAYYIATINIETAFHARTKQYKPFDGMILIDTFQMTEANDLVDKVVLPENNERAEKQLKQPIKVIIGNPPYSAGQNSENDDNKNIKYPTLDQRITDTYAKHSTATNKNSLYDSYIRSIRWASDRIGEEGIVAFVSNGSYIDGNATDGLRKCLADEFSSIYCFNLRGNIHKNMGNKKAGEGKNIFGQSSMTGIAVTLFVKESTSNEKKCAIHYHDIGDYLTQKEKLEKIKTFSSVKSMEWQNIKPNKEGDWINQRDPAFEQFLQIGNKDDKSAQTLFATYSRGVATSRDAWVYHYSKPHVADNVKRLIAKYQQEMNSYQIACKGKDNKPAIDAIIDFDPKAIKWSRALKGDASRNKALAFDASSIVTGMYRPFTRQWLYFNRRLNDMVYQIPRLFPTDRHQNMVISTTGIGAAKDFSALISDAPPNLHFHDTGQCFPLYWYEKVDEPEAGKAGRLFEGNLAPDELGYVRHEAISDWALDQFRLVYADKAITKETLFWYVYGILHSPEYKQRFAANLKKMLPRIPLAKDFWAFAKAGRELGKWHLNYETIEPYPVTEDKQDMMFDPADWRVQKMRFGRSSGNKDKSVINYNDKLTLRDIPLEAYAYIVNGKSAIEWIVERYAVKVDKSSGIRNDPNDWCTEHEDPQYIVKLLKRVIRISIETVKIVNSLPPLEEKSN